MSTYRKRHVERILRHALDDTRVVVVNGARQAGKSTTVHHLVRGQPEVLERNLDRPSELAAARHDPTSFVAHRGLVVIDEIQRAPELVLPIKARVDSIDRAGQFLLTGSARLLGLRSLPDALVGRSETIELWPFSQGEIDCAPDGFIDAAFEAESEFATAATLDRSDYVARALRGGFPGAVDRAGARRARFFESYIRDLIDRDVTQLAEIQRRDDLNRLISLLANRAATPLSIDGLANVLSASKNTVERYVALFEEVFLIKRLPAWTNSATARATRSRKLIFADSGLCAHLAGLTADRLRREPARAGSLLENFVVSEIMRQLVWSETFARAYHYRTRDGQEVDAVVEHHDGRLLAVEVKASSTATTADLRHLAHLRDKTSDQFHIGILLYTGTQILHFGDRLVAVPIDSLWETAPPTTKP